MKPGDIILLFATGLGMETTPPVPAGQVVTASATLVDLVSVGGVGQYTYTVYYAGLVSTGLYQINVRIPEIPDGDYPVVVQIGGVRSQEGAFVTIRR